jgi:hypothetical protein
MKTHYIIIMAIAIAFLMSPATADVKYMSGSPDLSASLSGINEFSPDREVTMTVVVQNKGINDIKMVQPMLASPGDLPNTAKLVTVSLTGADGPFTVKSDSQMVGDILGGSTVPVPFTVRINKDAAPGVYGLPLYLNYTYLYTAEQVGADSITYHYKVMNDTFLLPVKVKPVVSLEVLNATPEQMNAGANGYIDLVLRNKGYENGTKAVIRIVKDSASPVTPVDSSVYIGDFQAFDTVHLRYKVAVSSDAGNKSYPVSIVSDYENDDGDTVTSDPVTVGIPVGDKVDFTIISPPPAVHPGSNVPITVIYKNTGGAPVYSAQARISMVDPFTSNDDVAYLGDLKPGEEATAHFQVAVDKLATIKQYGLDSEIRYRDALDDLHVSDIIKVQVDVTGRTGIDALLSNSILMSIVVAVIIGAVYYVFFYRKRKEKGAE